MFTWIKTALKIGRFAYELINELRIEHKVNEEIKAQGRRIQSQRYQQASHMAGHEPKKGP